MSGDILACSHNGLGAIIRGLNGNAKIATFEIVIYETPHNVGFFRTIEFNRGSKTPIKVTLNHYQENGKIYRFAGFKWSVNKTMRCLSQPSIAHYLFGPIVTYQVKATVENIKISVFVSGKSSVSHVFDTIIQTFFDRFITL